MKDVIFYAELPDYRTSKKARMTAEGHDFEPFTRASIRRWADQGGKLNVCAIFQGREHHNADGTQEGLVSTFAHDDSDVSIGSAAWDYLRKRTIRIDEALARRLHPALFARLDSEGG